MAPKRKFIEDEIEETLDKQICFFCNRTFNDDRILMDHYKDKHYKCPDCGQRKPTIHSLIHHMDNVHKTKLTVIENALPERADPDKAPEIYCMIGYPPELREQHRAEVLNKYMEAEAEHVQKTGNHLKGSKAAKLNHEQNVAAKQAKIESMEDKKKRLEEHKQKKRAEKAARDAGLPLPATTPPAPSIKIEERPAPYNLARTLGEMNGGSIAGQGGTPVIAGGPTYPTAGSPPAQSPWAAPTAPGWSTSSGPYGYGVSYAPLGFQPQLPYHLAPQQMMQQAAPQAPQQAQEQPIQSSLPQVAGLPRRPSFATPDPSKDEMERMHSGQKMMSWPASFPPLQTYPHIVVSYPQEMPSASPVTAAPHNGPHNGPHAPSASSPLAVPHNGLSYNASNASLPSAVLQNGLSSNATMTADEWQQIIKQNYKESEQSAVPQSSGMIGGISEAEFASDLQAMIDSVTSQMPKSSSPFPQQAQQTLPQQSQQTQGSAQMQRFNETLRSNQTHPPYKTRISKDSKLHGSSSAFEDQSDFVEFEKEEPPIESIAELYDHEEIKRTNSAPLYNVDGASASKFKEANTAVVKDGEQKAKPAKASKKSKKQQASKLKLVYSDNATSPEERMAKSGRYAYKPVTQTDTIMAQAGEGSGEVVGPVDDALES